MFNKLILFTILMFGSLSLAQNKINPNDTLTSIRISEDKKITFQIYAPSADEVKIGGTDFPEALRNQKMAKLENGIWQVTLNPITPGSYRYTFMIDGVSTLDPKNPKVSESNGNTWSLVHVSGSEYMDTKDVPHGSVSEVTYFSKSLNKFRRMHVYLPYGYEKGKDNYPVFYLLHGAFDCDDSWSTVGRAGFILDNLIAEKKAVPMIVVMPAGHTGPFIFNAPRDTTKPIVDEFYEDFTKEIKPYIENNYRVLTDRKSTAIAGLSMGGGQTLSISIANLNDYAYVGVFSSGILELFRGNNTSGPSWEDRNIKNLQNAEAKKGLELLWMAIGKEDFLLQISRNSNELLKKYGFDVKYKETEGAHTWNKWREYLYEFTPLLFKK